jgi:GntR family transcriptional repressor for pyruvate dehydrogenase complex
MPANSQPPVESRLGPTFDPVRPSRVFEEICDRIRDQLATGALKPGDKLPAERELAKQFGVGRNALREALRSLENAGVISLEKGAKGGAFIRQGNPAAITAVMTDLMNLGSISLEELTEARVFILEFVVYLACQRATDEDFDALEENINRTEDLTSHGLFNERLEATAEFYKLLAKTTRNRVVSMIVDALTDILRQFVKTGASSKTLDGLIEARRRILKRLRARQPDKAAQELTKQLTALHHLLVATAKADQR